MTQRSQADNVRAGGLILKSCVVVFILATTIALSLFRIYGMETRHESRSSIWWSERVRGLTPATATKISLQRDVLDHYATYTILEKDLNAFLDVRFANGGTLHSFNERKGADAKEIGKVIGRLGWVVTTDTVVYHYAASNGGLSSFYHDPVTGLTYQSSAHW